MYYNLIPLMNKTPAVLPAAQTYFDRVVTNGGSLTVNEKTYINTFIGALGTDFAEFDRLWIFGLANSIAARTSLANPTSTMITAVNSPTFTASQGYTGNGTNSYLNTNYTPSTQGVKYTQTNASIFVYVRNNTIGDHAEIGAISGGNKTFILSRYTGALAYYPVNLASAIATPGVGIANSQGLTVANLNTTTLSIYRNSTNLGSTTIAPVSINAVPLFVCAANSAGTPVSLSTKQIALSGAGSGIINQTTFYNAVQALGTSIGWQV